MASSNTEGQSASLVMTQQSHAQMPQQISPKPVVSNYPLLENCLKMARFNLSEHEVLQKCLIPGNSSSTVIVPARGIDYTSSLVDMDDEYLLKTLEGNSDFSDSISGISTLSLSQNNKRKKKRSERWKNLSRKSSSSNPVIIIKHEDDDISDHDTVTIERPHSRNSGRASRHSTPTNLVKDDIVMDHDQSRHSTPRSHRSRSSQHDTVTTPIKHQPMQVDGDRNSGWADKIELSADDASDQEKTEHRSRRERPRSAHNDSRRDSMEGKSARRQRSRSHDERQSSHSRRSRHRSREYNDDIKPENGNHRDRVSRNGRDEHEKRHSNRQHRKETIDSVSEPISKNRHDSHDEQSVRPSRSERDRKKRHRHKDSSNKDGNGKHSDEIVAVEYDEKLGRNMRAIPRKERRQLKT